MRRFCLDTNVLLSNARAIFNFEEHEVIVPLVCIEELDNFKKDMNELGRNARHFSNIVDELREKGSLHDGVIINDKGGVFKIKSCEDVYFNDMPRELDPKVNDNKILAVAKRFNAILVSKDTNVRLKADVCGIKAENYRNERIEIDDLYTGRMQVQGKVNELTEPQVAPFDKIELETKPYPNQFLEVVEHHFDKDDIITCRYQPETIYTPEQIFPLREDLESWGLKPRNSEQAMAMDLLLDDDIKLCTISGPAGCGKTLITLACALRKVTDEFKYRKILVSRPVMPMGKDIGFLPGDIGEKLAPYMQPIYDNIEYLMSGYAADGAGKKRKKTKKEQKVEEEKELGQLGSGYLELLNAGIMQVEPLLYIRGRSIPNQILICDEAQNLSQHEIKTILTRAGEGTKIILTGDISQIDSPYLDATNNGLTYVIDRFKDQPIAGHVTLTKCERSELAEISSKIL